MKVALPTLSSSSMGRSLGGRLTKREGPSGGSSGMLSTEGGGTRRDREPRRGVVGGIVSLKRTTSGGGDSGCSISGTSGMVGSVG